MREARYSNPLFYSILIGWVGLMSEQSCASGLFPMVWDSSRRMIRRHAVAFLIKILTLQLPHFGTPRSIIWMGTWRTLHTRRILHAPDANSVHGGFRQLSLEPVLSVDEMKHSVITFQLRRHFSNWNIRKYVITQSKDVTSVQKIKKELLKFKYRLYVYSSISMKYKMII